MRPAMSYEDISRAPYGARGLKFGKHAHMLPDIASRPIRGAWIEMQDGSNGTNYITSRPIRGAWIEIACAVR